MNNLSDKNIALLTALEKGYFVNKEGLLIRNNFKTNPFIQNWYYTFSIRIKSKAYSVPLKVHKLQAYQKFGDKMFEKGIQVRHKNGIRTDNSWDNILIGTNSDNQMDIPKEVRVKRSVDASRKRQDKISSYEERCLIYENLKNKIPYNEIMLKHNVTSKGTLSFMKNKSKEYKEYINGTLVEWLDSSLQNYAHQFESDKCLQIGLWCNGSIRDFGSRSESSNLSKPTTLNFC